MHQEVFSRSLADDPEVVYKAGLKAYLAIVSALSHACRLILVARRQARPAHSLWLEVKLGMEITSLIKRSTEQDCVWVSDLVPYV